MKGWFGKGMYFATDPKYALEYCSTDEKCLIFGYAMLVNPFPIVASDQLKFLGQPAHKNYLCHFVPVKKCGKMDFRPPQDLKDTESEEVVIFQETHILPVCVIEIGEGTKASMSSPSKSVVQDWTVDDVVLWAQTLGLSMDYSSVFRDEAISGKVLITLKEGDLKEIGIQKFGDRRIMATQIASLI